MIDPTVEELVKTLQQRIADVNDSLKMLSNHNVRPWFEIKDSKEGSKEIVVREITQTVTYYTKSEAN